MTGHQGTTLGVDLYHLYLIGKVWLPDVADQYDWAMAHLDDPELGSPFLFGRSPALGGPDGPLRGVWIDANRELGRHLARTSANLTAAAEGVLRTMDAYATADAQARDTLDHLIHDRK